MNSHFEIASNKKSVKYDGYTFKVRKLVKLRATKTNQIPHDCNGPILDICIDQLVPIGKDIYEIGFCVRCKTLFIRKVKYNKGKKIRKKK